MAVTTTPEVSLTDRLFGWWYRIAAPPEVPEHAPLRDRMRVRSGRLTSVIFLIQIVIALVNTILVLIDPPGGSRTSIILPTITLIGTMLIGTILNRIGKTTIGGVLVLAILEFSLISELFRAPGGLSLLTLSIFYFLTIPELIAASLLLPWVTLPLALGNCLITVALITFMPKTPDLIQALNTHPYDIYIYSIELQIIVPVMCYLWVHSTHKEMKRANSAEEVNRLTMAMTMHQQAEQRKKQQLEESIQQIVSVHMQAANGNLNARVPLDRQNALWAVAGSLNNLLARLQRWRYDAVQLQKNEQALQQLLHNIQNTRKQGKPLKAYMTGTSLDAVIFEISKGIAAPQRPSD